MEKIIKFYNVAPVKSSLQGGTLKFTFTILIMLVVGVAFGQQSRFVRGTVVDQQKQPVIGAGVAVKGGASRAVTDINGAFSINVPADGRYLIVSYLGMTTQEVDISGKNTVTVTMKDDVAQ